MAIRDLTLRWSLGAQSRRFLRSNLFRGGVWSLTIQMQFVAIQLLTGIILARILGPGEFGTYSFALAVVTLIQIMPNSGLDNVVIRYSAQYRTEQSWTMLRGLWRTAIIASIAYGLLSATAMLVSTSLGWVPQTAALSPKVLAAAAIPMCFLPLATFFGAALRAVNPGVLGQLPQFVVRPWMYFLLILAVVALASTDLTADIAMYAQGAAAAATALIGLYWLTKNQPEQLWQEGATHEYKRWFRSVLPFCVMGGLMLINTQADILLLGILRSARETGLYKVAANGANLTALSLTAANLYIAPRISALWSKGQRQSLQRLLSLSARSTFLVAITIACVFLFWGVRLLELVFGSAYLAAYAPLMILCIGQLINVGAGSVGLILNMTDHEKAATKMAGFAAACNIVLNLILIPRFGGVGAAISTVIAMSIWNGLMFVEVRRKTGLNPSVFAPRTAV